MPKWKTLQSMQQFQPSALTALLASNKKKGQKKVVETANSWLKKTFAKGF